MILAGDIGGTNCRLIASDLEGRPLAQHVYASRDHASFAEVLARFIEKTGHRFDIACFGLPGPVLGHHVRLTNLPWEVDAQQLTAETGIPQVLLLNDLAANAYGLETLKPAELHTLNVGEPVPHGNIAIVAPGTGLGEAGLVYCDGQPLAIGSEGGHSDFGPTNDLELDLLRYALAHGKPGENETFIAGPGLVLIHSFLQERSGQATPTWLCDEFAAGDDSAAISNAALASKDPICEQALDLYVELLAGEAANLALKFLAVGGVYLGGGVPPKILPKLRTPRFLRRFTAKNRMDWLLPRIPVHVILNDRAALQGAVAHARNTLRNLKHA
jgi:glucokinase